jgi:hypothetical protein
MPSQAAMSLMNLAEFGLWVVLGLLFLRKKLHHRFPAMGIYLASHVASAPVLLFLLYGQSQHWFNDYCFAMYFFAFWTVYIVSAVLLYFICMEVFHSALLPFPGLMKFGMVAFRWVALASVLVAFSTISYTHMGVLWIPQVGYALMRSISILELCLLGFLCLSMNALHLSVRDLTFGIALGFGMMSSNEFLQSLLIPINTSLTAPLQFVYEAAILASLGIWVTYCFLPEPVRKPLMLPAASFLFRWNEIASALGHTGTQVAVQQPDDGFLLTDAEQTAERVIVQNMKSRESEPESTLSSF